MNASALTVGRAHTTLSQAVYEALRGQIVDRELPPGTRLVERELADSLDVSRVPVREALKELVRDGLAEQRGRSGLYVTELTRADVEEITELRGLLDALVFRRLTRMLTPSSRTLVDSLLVRTSRAIAEGRHAEAVLLNGEFHTLTKDLAGSRSLQAVMGVLDPRLHWLLAQHEDVAEVHRQHVAIWEAVRAGDVAAVDALAADHLAESVRMMLQVNPDLR